MRITVAEGIFAEIIDCPADERSQIRPVAVLPRFVNAHTHLEFSAIRAPLPPPEPFTDWIRSVIRYRIGNAEDPDFPASAVRSGCSESTSYGTQLVGEITTSESALSALRHTVNGTDGTAISFRELIGFTGDRVDEQCRIAKGHIEDLVQDQQSAVLPGLSPHAPYSAHPNVVAAAVDLARNTNVPLAMHLAETRDEIELLADKTGRFVDFLKSMNLWDADVLLAVKGPLHYLQELAKAPHALAIHCNYLTEDEIEFLGKHNHVAVVYCPRTHAWFGHTPHPWQALRATGATVILGTDSRASNPDLNIWKELQHVARQHNAPPIWELLPMITTEAARALNIDPMAFEINVDGVADFVEVRCDCEFETGLNEALKAAAIPQ